MKWLEEESIFLGVREYEHAGKYYRIFKDFDKYEIYEKQGSAYIFGRFCWEKSYEKALAKYLNICDFEDYSLDENDEENDD